MFAQTYYFAPGAQILVPAIPCKAVIAPVAFGPSLTLARGQAIGIKTSNGLAYAFNKDATDGTQIFAGFNQVAGATDSNSIFYPVFSGTPAGVDFYATGLEYSGIFTSGVFDPQLLLTSPTGSPTAEVDTVTPTNPTTGDIYTVTSPAGAQATFTVGATQTAAAVVTGLIASWNANPDLVAIGASSGSSTFIVTAATKGLPMNLAAGVSGTGTVALVITTPAVTGQTSGVITITPGGSVTTGDVWTLTITWPNATTHTVTATVGSTQTATGIVTLLKTAWNNDTLAAGIATATGTSTLILTATLIGNIPPVTSAVVGTGTVSQSTTTPAFGRNIADIQISRPSAYILQPYGFWNLP
jgi:hypothetical protein